MIDIKFITENPEKIREGLKRKNVSVELDKILILNEDRKTKQIRLEELRAKQNEASKKIASGTPQEKEALTLEMKNIKDEAKNLEADLTKLEEEIDDIASYVPNPPLNSAPNGKGEEENVVEKKFGKIREFDFQPKDHIELGKILDIIDIERGARTSGARFYYLKNEAVLLEFALIQFVIGKLIKNGFKPIIPPVLVKEEAMYATGFFPADRNEIYSVNPNEDNLFLVGTSEVPLTMLHAGEMLENKKLPLRYCGFSPCFRREAGSYGKDTTGIIRVHQFDKIEMYSFCHPDKSEEEHELIRKMEEEIMTELELPYQVLNICSGDLGAPAAKKYDIEVFIPTQGKYRELTSCSNCTDFQARRAKIRFKGEKENKYVHTLNGTAVAVARTLVAIIENYQNSDSSVTIPKVLLPFMHGVEKIVPKK